VGLLDPLSSSKKLRRRAARSSMVSPSSMNEKRTCFFLVATSLTSLGENSDTGPKYPQIELSVLNEKKELGVDVRRSLLRSLQAARCRRLLRGAGGVSLSSPRSSSILPWIVLFLRIDILGVHRKG
jgi:hypothetical protein